MDWTLQKKDLVKQGAEALVYKTTFILADNPCLLKVRPSKAYRHPILDLRLTRHRCLSEARLLVRCRAGGVPCPAVYFVDETSGAILMEWIEGGSLRDILDSLLKQSQSREKNDISQYLGLMMARVGEAIGLLHNLNVVHGDLTTSNIMLRKSEEAEDVGMKPLAGQNILNDEIVLIDFGLGSVSSTDEDKAVDLYVLERAFTSTHPKAESLFPALLLSYEKSYKTSKAILKKLQEVRLRGRKRSMLG